MRTQNRDCEIKKYVTIKTMGNVEQIGYKAHIRTKSNFEKTNFQQLFESKKLLFIQYL